MPSLGKSEQYKECHEPVKGKGPTHTSAEWRVFLAHRRRFCKVFFQIKRVQNKSGNIYHRIETSGRNDSVLRNRREINL